MLFDETGEDGATSVAERITAAIKKLSFTDKNAGAEFGITATVGMVGIRTDEVRELSRDTDASLTTSKKRIGHCISENVRGAIGSSGTKNE